MKLASILLALLMASHLSKKKNIANTNSNANGIIKGPPFAIISQRFIVGAGAWPEGFTLFAVSIAEEVAGLFAWRRNQIINQFFC